MIGIQNSKSSKADRDISVRFPLLYSFLTVPYLLSMLSSDSCIQS